MQVPRPGGLIHVARLSRRGRGQPQALASGLQYSGNVALSWKLFLACLCIIVVACYSRVDRERVREIDRERDRKRRQRRNSRKGGRGEKRT